MTRGAFAPRASVLGLDKPNQKCALEPFQVFTPSKQVGLSIPSGKCTYSGGSHWNPLPQETDCLSAVLSLAPCHLWLHKVRLIGVWIDERSRSHKGQQEDLYQILSLHSFLDPGSF